jgi:hypothetical protein
MRNEIVARELRAEARSASHFSGICLRPRAGNCVKPVAKAQLTRN